MTGWASDITFKVSGIGYKVIDNSNHYVAVVNKARPTIQESPANVTYKGTVTIPKTVTYSGNGIKYTVTTIADNAFQYGSGMTALTIPNTVTTISSSAFTNATGLKILTIEDGTSSIGISLPSSPLTKLHMGRSITTYGAIKKATNLILTVGDGVTNICYGMFNGCSTLKTISIPETITSVSEQSTVVLSASAQVLRPSS